MGKIYEKPEITVTKFDLNRNIMTMLDMEKSNEGPGDGWNAGVDDLSSGDYDNPDFEL